MMKTILLEDLLPFVDTINISRGGDLVGAAQLNPRLWWSKRVHRLLLCLDSFGLVAGQPPRQIARLITSWVMLMQLLEVGIWVADASWELGTFTR